MSAAFRVLATAHFARLFEKLEKTHPGLPEIYRTALAILVAAPYNRTRTNPIRKLVNALEGGGQYRLRLGRWHFRYDIAGRDVVLKYCG